MPFTRKFVRSNDEFEMLREERRSFSCPNKLWEELLKQTEGITSASEFVKLAIIEKMSREEPEKEDYFKELLLRD